MRQERETVPPSHEEREGVEKFEERCKDEGDFWATLRHVAELAGIGK